MNERIEKEIELLAQDVKEAVDVANELSGDGIDSNKKE